MHQIGAILYCIKFEKDYFVISDLRNQCCMPAASNIPNVLCGFSKGVGMGGQVGMVMVEGDWIRSCLK